MENFLGIFLKLDFEKIWEKNFEKIFGILGKDIYGWDLGVYSKWKRRYEDMNFLMIFYN